MADLGFCEGGTHRLEIAATGALHACMSAPSQPHTHWLSYCASYSNADIIPSIDIKRSLQKAI